MQTQKKARLPLLIGGIVLLAAGLVCAILTRSQAVAEHAAESSKLFYALSLIAILIGLVGAIAGLPSARAKTNVRVLALASLFAALCYIGFSFFKIDIPVGTEKTAFHLGNVFCVLAALFLGGVWGGMAGAVGMTIADLTTGYITSAPKTFLLKLCIGLIVGLVSGKLLHLERETKKSRLVWGTFLSAAAGMLFNMIADPVVGFFYKTYILGVPQEAAAIWAKIGAVTTAVNAVIAVLAASVFYLAIRPALHHAGLLERLR